MRLITRLETCGHLVTLMITDQSEQARQLYTKM